MALNDTRTSRLWRNKVGNDPHHTDLASSLTSSPSHDSPELTHLHTLTPLPLFSCIKVPGRRLFLVPFSFASHRPLTDKSTAGIKVKAKSHVEAYPRTGDFVLRVHAAQLIRGRKVRQMQANPPGCNGHEAMAEIPLGVLVAHSLRVAMTSKAKRDQWGLAQKVLFTLPRGGFVRVCE